MSKVHTLPPDVISKIAAGEVIERPASVVKELLENALDAGATAIELHLTEAGKTSITIKDDGHGIEPDDLETIFLRHATSKISSVDDLFNIHSLGFRGEALYSVAAIADITLRSRAVGQDSGWDIHLRGGEKLDHHPAAMNQGTEITITELFFNTPARRKFLKSNTTELNHILGTVIPYTFLYPGCRFLVTHQKRKLLDLAPAPLTRRIAEAMNHSEDYLIEAAQEHPDHHSRIRVVLGDINIARSRRDQQFIFINGRPVDSRSLGYHLNDVYRLIFPQGQHPFFAVFLDLPAADLDVNVHPTKREVKIRNEQEIVPVLRRLVEYQLLTGGKMKEAKDTDAPSDSSRPAAPRSFSYEPGTSDFKPPAGKMPFTDPVSEPAAPAYDRPRSRITEQYSFPQSSALPSGHLFAAKEESLPDKLGRSRYIGPLIDKFLLWEADKSLLIIDQHAAQERITFELLIQQMDKGTIEVQHLLSPYTIRLSPTELLNWDDAKDQLEEMGFESTQFDDETIAVHTYPVLVKDPQRAVQEIIAGGEAARVDHESLARRACRASIMAGDPLKPEQAENLRTQLLNCRDPFTCPHGRPTVIEMKEDFLDKQFLRT